MWEEVFNLAINNGLWAVLFLGLLIYQLRDSKNREQKYQNTIKDLTNAVGNIKKIKEDVINIGEDVKEVNKNVINIKSDVKEVDSNIKKIKLKVIKNSEEERKKEELNKIDKGA